jgi:hypothetical protein
VVEDGMSFGPWAIGKKTLWALRFVFAVSLIPFFSSLTAQPSKERRQVPSTGSKLTLRVYNYTGLDSASLASSERVANAIFQSVGIEPVWVDCPTSKLNAVAYQACDSPMGPADFVLRILPRHMAAKLHHSYDSLGFAQTCPDSEPACELNIFYHRIDELAAQGYRADRILGYVMAHEIAHILIGPAHSEEGIMRAGWTPRDLQHISLGLSLDFSGEQSRKLRLAVLRRAATTAQEELIQANLISH